jgi:hypothetical protein
MPNTPRDKDVGKQIDAAIPDPDVARRIAEDMDEQAAKRNFEGGAHPLHDTIFGEHEEGPNPDADDTPPGASRAAVNLGVTAVQPEGFGPMRSLGDTEQHDRQPDGGRKR